MIHYLFLLFSAIAIDALHFNGGTIRWVPTDPYDNSSSITITIMQSYWWSYPAITCANNVPISSTGRQNSNLSCVVDCSTDGGYSTHPIDILTDCISVSTSLGILTSQRSVNTTLTSGAHFYLAFVGSAWRALNDPPQSGLEWSILTFIDLRMRPDGFINTPPVASVVSPQYVIVNRTTQIQIAVSDVNAGDDVRCRWSTYTSGYRRRRRLNQEEYTNQEPVAQTYNPVAEKGENILIRKIRSSCGISKCLSLCRNGCPCSCPICVGTDCNSATCQLAFDCLPTTTTSETPGTLKSTSSYPQRQAIDECGSICYPGSMPNGTSLSNCTLSFTGLIPGTWYAATIQVEDFFNTTDTTPMSSVPVQFLIYVMPEPTCSEAPIILPLSDCLEVAIGVSSSFTLSVLNSCDPSISNVTAIIVLQGITGMQVGNLTQSPTNSSLSDVTLMWTPQADQNGSQELCMIAYTDEQVQSVQYCVTFIVITSLEVCKTTTTTSTTSTISTSTSSTQTTETTASTTTTTSTSTTTTATTSTTSTATTTTTTSVTTTSTSSTSTTTSVTTTSTSSTSTTTSSTSTTATTTVATIAVAATTTTTNNPGKNTNWGLIAGISSLALPLALCSCYCLYRLLWSPKARRQRQRTEEENTWSYDHLNSSAESMLRTTTPNTTANAPIEVLRKSYQVYNIHSPKHSSNSVCTTPESEGSILVSIYNNTNARRANRVLTCNTEQSFEMGNAWMYPSNDETINSEISVTRRAILADSSSSKMSNIRATNKSFQIDRQLSNQQNMGTLSSPSDIGQGHSSSGESFNFKDWTRLYLFGHKPDTGMPRMPRPS